MVATIEYISVSRCVSLAFASWCAGLTTTTMTVAKIPIILITKSISINVNARYVVLCIMYLEFCIPLIHSTFYLLPINFIILSRGEQSFFHYNFLEHSPISPYQCEALLQYPLFPHPLRSLPT